MDAKQRKKLEAENQKKIAEMLSREENQSCADCGERSPRWASVNLGCFVCIRCCGLHRKMGSHVSKIKSINLDFWLPENIAQCQAWGNGRINQRFLSRGNAPSPNVASDRDMEIYIKNKYERMLYTLDAPLPAPPLAANTGQLSNRISGNPNRFENELQTLHSMGFNDDTLNISALQAANGSLQDALDNTILKTTRSPVGNVFPSSASPFQPQTTNNHVQQHPPQQYAQHPAKQISKMSRFPESHHSHLHSLGFNTNQENENALLISNGNLEQALEILLEWRGKKQPATISGSGQKNETKPDIFGDYPATTNEFGAFHGVTATKELPSLGQKSNIVNDSVISDPFASFNVKASVRDNIKAPENLMGDFAGMTDLNFSVPVVLSAMQDSKVNSIKALMGQPTPAMFQQQSWGVPPNQMNYGQFGQQNMMNNQFPPNQASQFNQQSNQGLPMFGQIAVVQAQNQTNVAYGAAISLQTTTQNQAQFGSVTNPLQYGQAQFENGAFSQQQFGGQTRFRSAMQPAQQEIIQIDQKPRGMQSDIFRPQQQQQPSIKQPVNLFADLDFLK